jgi:phage/plasmid-associated DNA primase
MIEGTQKWLRDGLKPPAAVVNATRYYFAAEDEFGGWLSTCCRDWPRPAWTDKDGEHPAEQMPIDGKQEPANYTALSYLKQSFDSWRNPHEDKSIKGIDPTTLARKLRKKGYRTEHTRTGTVVWGLKIREAVEAGSD